MKSITNLRGVDTSRLDPRSVVGSALLEMAALRANRYILASLTSLEEELAFLELRPDLSCLQVEKRRLQLEELICAATMLDGVSGPLEWVGWHANTVWNPTTRDRSPGDLCIGLRFSAYEGAFRPVTLFLGYPDSVTEAIGEVRHDMQRQIDDNGADLDWASFRREPWAQEVLRGVGLHGDPLIVTLCGKAVTNVAEDLSMILPDDEADDPELAKSPA